MAAFGCQYACRGGQTTSAFLSKAEIRAPASVLDEFRLLDLRQPACQVHCLMAQRRLEPAFAVLYSAVGWCPSSEKSGQKPVL